MIRLGRNGRRGITLPEVVVSVAVMGVVAFLIPLIFKILNSANYIQRSAYLQNEAKDILWQITHDIDNAANVEFTKDPLDATKFLPDILTIWVFDLKRYGNNINTFENPDMFAENDPGDATKKNWGQVTYRVVTDDDGTPSKDLNGNSRADKPYLLRQTHWANSFRTSDRAETFFLGSIQPTPPAANPKTFEPFNGNEVQTIKINFRLKAAFSKPSDPPRIFTAVVTMRNPKP